MFKKFKIWNSSISWYLLSSCLCCFVHVFATFSRI